MYKIFEALSDPSRIKIVELLRKGDMTAGEISDHFSFSKPTLSHHLNVLKNAGIIASRREGQNIIYSLDTTVFEDIIFFIQKLKGGKNG